jgi:hypothetical protein
MVDLRDTLSDETSGLEALISKIPGYGGYKDKELRREADQKLREHLAAKLGEQLRQAEAVAGQMLTGPGIMQLDEFGTANTRLQTLIDKVKTAAQGYAGFFDAVKIREDELDLLYEFDEEMIFKVDDIAAAIEGVQIALDSGDAAKIPAAVRAYGQAVGEALANFHRRKDVLLGLE